MKMNNNISAFSSEAISTSSGSEGQFNDIKKVRVPVS
jgi:hypothetical protein